MAKNTTKAKSNTEEIRHNQRGELLFTTLTPENNFYRENPNLLQMAQYIVATGKNSFKMKNENSVFSFTDYSIYEMIVTNEDEELIENTYFVVAYDNTTNTCYYTMSKGLTSEFLKMKENNIIPSNGFCKWTAKVTEKAFKDEETGKEKRTFNLEILGIDNFNSEVVVERKPELLTTGEDPAPETIEA